MELLTRERIDAYGKNDSLAQLLETETDPEDRDLTCHRWLLDSAPKRYAFTRLYRELLEGSDRLRVLDVGGGLTGLSKKFASSHDYTLLELLAHDRQDGERIASKAGREFIAFGDWYEFESNHRFDLIVANDLFPNVDQRLEAFIEKWLPRTKKLRLSLTFYNQMRYYVTRRVNAEEILCMLAWNGEMTAHVMQRFRDHIVDPDFGVFQADTPSVYPNGRQVCLVELSDLDTMGFNFQPPFSATHGST